MTTLAKFYEADRKVTEIENNGGTYFGEGYGTIEHTQEYNEALEEAQRLYKELEARGVNPF